MRKVDDADFENPNPTYYDDPETVARKISALNAKKPPPLDLRKLYDLFRIDELLRYFLHFCDNTTLARLARTCKELSDPALDELWSELESFGHLLRLFPENLISWSPMENGAFRPNVNHLIVPRDWKRFRVYAPRVKRWLRENLIYIDEAVVDHLAFGRLPEYILPRLTHIEVSGPCVSAIHLQTLLLCPLLETVNIINVEPNVWTTRAMNAFFRTLADRSPKLKKLVVRWSETITGSFVDGLSEVFDAQPPNLETVHLLSQALVDARLFPSLARLNSLVTLNININRTPEAPLNFGEIDRSESFPCLKNLVLHGRLEELPKVLQFCCNSNVANLVFHTREFTKTQELYALFDFVAANFPSLVILQFNGPSDEVDIALATRHYEMRPDAYTLDRHVLQPLLDLRCLAAVHLELGVPIQLTDSDLIAIGDAWPKIEVLYLSADPYADRHRGIPPQCTVEGLCELVKKCPMLSHLGLFMDFGAEVTEDQITSCELVSSSLLHLDVGRSWILLPSHVAAILSGLFPSLKEFVWTGRDDPESWQDMNGGHSPGWRQVYDLLPVFRAARTNEIRRKVSGSSVSIDSGMHID